MFFTYNLIRDDEVIYVGVAAEDTNEFVGLEENTDLIVVPRNFFDLREDAFASALEEAEALGASLNYAHLDLFSDTATLHIFDHNPIYSGDAEDAYEFLEDFAEEYALTDEEHFHYLCEELQEPWHSFVDAIEDVIEDEVDQYISEMLED